MELTKYYCVNCHCSAVAMLIKLSSYMTWSASETVASVQLPLNSVLFCLAEVHSHVILWHQCSHSVCKWHHYVSIAFAILQLRALEWISPHSKACQQRGLFPCLVEFLPTWYQLWDWKNFADVSTECFSHHQGESELKLYLARSSCTEVSVSRMTHHVGLFPIMGPFRVIMTGMSTGHMNPFVKHSHLSSSDVLAEETDERMVEFAMGGVCNCCLDKLNKSYIVENDGVELTVKCLSRSVSTYVDNFTRFCYHQSLHRPQPMKVRVWLHHLSSDFQIRRSFATGDLDGCWWDQHTLLGCCYLFTTSLFTVVSR